MTKFEEGFIRAIVGCHEKRDAVVAQVISEHGDRIRALEAEDFSFASDHLPAFLP